MTTGIVLCVRVPVCVSRLPPVSLNRYRTARFKPYGTGTVRFKSPFLCVPAPPGVFLPVPRTELVVVLTVKLGNIFGSHAARSVCGLTEQTLQNNKLVVLRRRSLVLVRAPNGGAADSRGNVRGPPPPNHSRGTHVARSCNRAFSCRQEVGSRSWIDSGFGKWITLWKVAQQGLCTFSPSSGPARAHVLIVHRHSVLTT
jgi:hypothetical protein